MSGEGHKPSKFQGQPYSLQTTRNPTSYQSIRTPFNPGSKLEDQLFNAPNFKELFTIAIENKSMKDSKEKFRWRVVYFFLRGLRHSQFAQSRSYQYPKELKELEQEAFGVMTDIMRSYTEIKSYHLIRVIELMFIVRFDYPAFWQVIEDHILYTAEYENLKDVIEMLDMIKEGQHLQKDSFWQLMMEKIVGMSDQLTSLDIVGIIDIYTHQGESNPRRKEMCLAIRNHHRQFIHMRHILY